MRCILRKSSRVHSYTALTSSIATTMHAQICSASLYRWYSQRLWAWTPQSFRHQKVCMLSFGSSAWDFRSTDPWQRCGPYLAQDIGTLIVWDAENSGIDCVPVADYKSNELQKVCPHIKRRLFWRYKLVHHVRDMPARHCSAYRTEGANSPTTAQRRWALVPLLFIYCHWTWKSILEYCAQNSEARHHWSVFGCT